MRGKSHWLVALVIILVPLQSVVRATSLTDPLAKSFGAGNDIGASLDNVNSVALGDLDNDGDLDIVSGSNVNEDFEIITWQNSGSPFSGLWTQNDVGAASYGVKSVVLGDLDNDGDLDIVSGDQEGVVTSWQNDGTPFIGTWPSNEVGDNTWGASVAMGDLDNDGYLDIVCGSDSSEDYEVVAWQNDGSPFSGSWTQNDVGVSSVKVLSVAVGDLDHDGDLDVVTGSNSGEDYEIITWQNDGTPFSNTWSANDVGTTNDVVYSVVLGDLDQDGDLDIVSGSQWGAESEVGVWQNDGTPFSGLWAQNGAGNIYDSVNSVTTGDLDKDGDLDIVAGANTGAPIDVCVLQNDGTPFSDAWIENEVGYSNANVRSVAIGDLDNDGDLDVVSGRDSGGDFEIIGFQNTLIQYALPLRISESAVGTSTDSVYSVTTGDLDNDGDMDIVSGSTSNEDYEVIAWQNNDTPFDGSWTQNNVGATTGSIYCVAIGDLDNDGDLDVISVGSSAATYEIIIWENDGTPFSDTWTPNNVGTSLGSVWEVRVGDLDHDGKLDLATVSDSNPNYEVIVWKNDGSPFTGTWLSNDVGASTADVNSLALGDLNNDGYLDIVSGSESGEDYELIAWENDSSPFSGLWTQHDIGATGANIYSVNLGDLDNDGDLDLVSGGGIQEDFEVISWQNDGTPFDSLWVQNDVGISDAIVSNVALGDIDNDGDLDIVSGNQDAEESEVVVWENDGTPFSELWTKYYIGTSEDHIYSIELADLNNDGDMDIVTGSADSASYEIIAWQNRGKLLVYLPIIMRSNP